MEQIEAEKLVTIFAAAFPQANLSEATVAVYVAALVPMTYRDGNLAVQRCVRECKWLPTVSEILDRIVQVTLSLPSAEEAWAEVHGIVKEWGYSMLPRYRDGVLSEFSGWSSPVVWAAVEAVGWRRICLSGEDQGFIHRDFIRAYDSFGRRADEYVRLGGIMPLAAINGPVSVIRQCVAELLRRQGDGQAVMPTPIGPALLAAEPDDVLF